MTKLKKLRMMRGNDDEGETHEKEHIPNADADHQPDLKLFGQECGR